MTTSNTLNDFQTWYDSHCDGDWEHDWRVRISTLDNPGWDVRVNLDDTETPNALERVDVERGPNDWYSCWVRERVFYGVGGPANLAAILELFLSWVGVRPDIAGSDAVHEKRSE